MNNPSGFDDSRITIQGIFVAVLRFLGGGAILPDLPFIFWETRYKIVLLQKILELCSVPKYANSLNVWCQRFKVSIASRLIPPENGKKMCRN